MKTWTTFAATLCLLASCHTEVQRTEKDFVGIWLEVTPIYTQGMSLDANGTAISIGMETLKYDSWSLSDGRLVLNGKSIGNGQTIDFSDTLEVLKLTPDSMQLGRGQLRIDYYRSHAQLSRKLRKVNPVDSLVKTPGTGELQTRVYRGTLPAASCPGIDCTITLYNYEHSGDGVFEAHFVYLEAEDGKDFDYKFYGRQYTQRGNAVDKDATVYQFVPFDDGSNVENMYFQLKGNNLEMLARDQKPIESELNYTLKLQ